MLNNVINKMSVTVNSYKDFIFSLSISNYRFVVIMWPRLMSRKSGF